MKGNTDVWQTTASVLKLRRRGRSQCIVSTTCFIDNNVSPHVKFCLWNPVSWALESRVQVKESGILPGLESRFRIPLTKTGIKFLESGIQGMESRIQDCLGFPCMGRMSFKPDRIEKRPILYWFMLSFLTGVRFHH